MPRHYVIKMPIHEEMLITNKSQRGGNQFSCLIQIRRHKNNVIISTTDHKGNLLKCGKLTMKSENTTQNTGELFKTFNVLRFI